MATKKSKTSGKALPPSGRPVAKKSTSRKKSSAKSEAIELEALDSTAEFEELLKNAVEGQKYVLKLYVTGSSLRSGQAISSIRSLCEEHLAGRYDLEVIDIYQQPDEARNEQIIAAPTLIKESPMPPRRMVGDLSDRDKVMLGLNLRATDQEPANADKTKWVQL